MVAGTPYYRARTALTTPHLAHTDNHARKRKEGGVACTSALYTALQHHALRPENGDKSNARVNQCTKTLHGVHKERATLSLNLAGLELLLSVTASSFLQPETPGQDHIHK